MKKITEEEKLIKKLMTQNLSAEERSILDESIPIKEVMGDTWNKVPLQCVDKEKEERILKGILYRIRGNKKSHFQIGIKRNGWAALAAILLFYSSLSTWLLIENKPVESTWYVMKSGYQSMDSVQLPDGTSVMLNASSKLIYPQTFTGKERVVTLSGQAFFKVRPDKKHPFIVKTKQMNVTALGTAFEVFSFDEDSRVETVLLEGKVKVEPKDERERVRGQYILEPNQKLTYEKECISVRGVNAGNYSSWHVTGRLSFKNEKLSMIIPRLEKWYGQKITCKDKKVENARFTFTVKDEPLKLILDFITGTNPSLIYRVDLKGSYELNTKK